MDAIRHFAGKVPILGVCLGHQCIGQVFGGRVVRAGKVMHGKTSKVFHDERGLFRGLPNPFVAMRYHSLVIAPDSMPEALEVTAKTWDDEIMGVRHRELAVEGVQFHPESIMTVEGKRMLENFLR
jgi:anthranilate synthase/aminodeoxychorismate synthase-like glutamine amidotransferase